MTPDPDEITPGQRMLAGALAGAVAQATIYPFELVGGAGPVVAHGGPSVAASLACGPLLSSLAACVHPAAACACDTPHVRGNVRCNAVPLQVRTRLAVCSSNMYGGIVDCTTKVGAGGAGGSAVCTAGAAPWLRGPAATWHHMLRFAKAAPCTFV